MAQELTLITRRRFGLCLGAAGLSWPAVADEFAGMPWNQPATVARVYLASNKPHWPKTTLDVEAERADVENRLKEVATRNAAVAHLTGGEVLRADADVKPWLAKMGAVDGVLIIPLTQPTPALTALINALEAPALFFSRPYATHAWSGIGAQAKAGRRIDVIATSNYGDLDPYLRVFKTAHHLKHSKVLVGVAQPGGRAAVTEAYTKHFGTQFKFVPGPAFKAAFAAASDREAKAEAEAFTRGALKVMDATPAEIHNGVRFYLALKNMLKAERANALTIDCFGSLAANTLPGYPCIAWSKLNDAGLYGVCEADLHSTMTQLLVTSYARVPGFVSDPVFDTSRNEVIHAHCVSATKMSGLDGPSSPYLIRNHLETNEGAVVQVLMPSQQTVTVARFTEPRRMLVSTAEVIGPVTDSDRGCRSQIRTRVKDAEKWLRGYSAGLHRVIFYGDQTAAIARLGRLFGFEMVTEM
jgi:hypothetical protein